MLSQLVDCTCEGDDGGEMPAQEVGMSPITPTATISTTASNTTPRYCTHRYKYHEHSTAKSEGDQHSLSSGSVDERDPADVKLVRLRPHWTAEPKKQPDLIDVIQPTNSTIVVKKHLVNESLDKYVVLRQRSFHGYMRSKEELRSLPLTDPRDDIKAPHTWLHRSKTDLYVEKKFRRKQKHGSQKLTDLSGLSLRSIVDNLPSSKKEYTAQRRERTADKIRRDIHSSQSQPEERLPPLTVDSIMKGSLKKQNGRRPWSDGTHATTTKDFHVPLPQKKSISLPLHVWESKSTSVDFLLVSHPKVLHDRDPSSFPVHAMISSSVTREQTSPLK